MGLGLRRRNFFKWVRLNVVFNLLNILCHTILILLHHKEKRKNVCDFSSPLYHNAKGWKGKKERRAFHWILWGIVLMHTWWARWVVKSRLIEWGKHSLSSFSSSLPSPWSSPSFSSTSLWVSVRGQEMLDWMMKAFPFNIIITRMLREVKSGNSVKHIKSIIFAHFFRILNTTMNMNKT